MQSTHLPSRGGKGKNRGENLAVGAQMLVVLDGRDGCLVGHDASRWEQLRSWLSAGSLDRALAQGAAPDSTVLLALRAQALVRPVVRRKLASAIAEVLAEARRPPARTRRWAVPVRRQNVRAAMVELEALADRVTAPGPLSVGGLARARHLLYDGSGPMYFAGSPEQLRTALQEALDALDPVHDR